VAQDNIAPQRQNIEIQERLSTFTFWLVVVGLLQIVVLATRVAYGIRAANAAKKAADVA
jgi:hypothetical protein